MKKLSAAPSFVMYSEPRVAPFGCLNMNTPPQINPAQACAVDAIQNTKKLLSEKRSHFRAEVSVGGVTEAVNMLIKRSFQVV